MVLSILFSSQVLAERRLMLKTNGLKVTSQTFEIPSRCLLNLKFHNFFGPENTQDCNSFHLKFFQNLWKQEKVISLNITTPSFLISSFPHHLQPPPPLATIRSHSLWPPTSGLHLWPRVVTSSVHLRLLSISIDHLKPITSSHPSWVGNKFFDLSYSISSKINESLLLVLLTENWNSQFQWTVA